MPQGRMLGELGITHSKVWPAAVEGFRNKHINIQIGVNTLSRRNPSELWVEFDPTNEALATPNRLVLPFIVTAELSDRGHAVQPFFVKHALSACSSTLLSAGAWTRANSSSHAEVASQACRSLASNVSPNVSTPLWPWGDDYRAMIASRSRTHATAGGKHGHEPWRGACFICQDADASSLRRVEFPALGLGYFLTELRPAQVDSLIIDAQGLDFRIIRSLNLLSFGKSQGSCSNAKVSACGLLTPQLLSGCIEKSMGRPRRIAAKLHSVISRTRASFGNRRT